MKHSVSIEVIPCLLDPAEQTDLISSFYESYYNTNQDTNTFSSEFFYVVGFITTGFAPVKLKYLTDFHEYVFLSNPKYKAAIDAYKRGELNGQENDL